MKSKYKICLFIIGILIAICLISFQSYALWLLNLKQTGVNELISDCFDVTFDELAGSNIKLENAFPLTDAEGEKLDAYHFTIKNKCQAFVKYQLQIEVTDSSTLDSKYVKVKLNQETPNLLQNYDPSDHLLLNNTESGYILETDYLEKGQTKEYDLRIWLDESVTTDSVNEDGSKVQESNWGGYITLDASYAEKIEKNVLLAGQTIPLVSEGEGLYEVKHDDYDGEGFNNTEYRYAGKDPNNYIDFNGEQNTWRIIGLVNVKTKDGNYEQRVKIIRNVLGEIIWNTTEDDSYPSDWSNASLMNLLNEGSYYTRSDPYAENGLTTYAKDMIDTDITWTLGGVGGTRDDYDFLVQQMYRDERKNDNSGKISSEWKTTDENHKASVGLMYPSDYGYATVGGSKDNREACLGIKIDALGSEESWSEHSDCYKNDWIYTDSWLEEFVEWQGTISPHNYNFYQVIGISIYGSAGDGNPNGKSMIRPVVYLKPEVVINGGSGAYGDNYTIEIKEEKKTLIDTIKEVDTVSEGDGLYVVSHNNDGTNLEEEWKDTDELRYAGKDPKNYVKFNDENTWRIIGLVNVKTTSGKIEQRVKIIRDSIGEYSWDSSEDSVNMGLGVNEWSESDIMKLLNPGYETNKDQICKDEEECQENQLVNNSLYWNGEEGQCYYGSNNSTTSCEFSSTIGLSQSVDYISDDIVWNTGTNGENDYKKHDYGLPRHFYEYERSKNTGKCVFDETSCNDDVTRKNEWKTENDKKALVGLMYPSDYGYATSGGTETDRTSCLDTEMYSWDGSADCYNNDWLLPEFSYQWTMSPSESAVGMFFIVNDDIGSVAASYVGNAFAICPVVYLKPDVVVNNSNTADGSSDHPYELALG